MSVSVAIVGGGPIGLTLGCLLSLAGIDCRVYEARTQRSLYSRAIGIHPPAQQVLDSIGVLTTMLAEGISVSQGQGYYGTHRLGTLALPAPVLSIPQTRTEEILEARLQELNPAAYCPGVAIEDISALKADFIIGCDGKNSIVRQQAGIGWSGITYPDTYLMGDFDDNTDFGNEAIICLTPRGLVESFPLPGKKRRWVAWTKDAFSHPDAEHLSVMISARVGRSLPVNTNTWISTFGIERFTASRFVQGNIALAGDAAHIVSPIGGQGMNLGILDAAALSETLIQIIQHGADPTVALQGYEAQQRPRIIAAGRQAALNTYLGRPCGPLSPELGFVRIMLAVPPLTRLFARKFTMLDI